MIEWRLALIALAITPVIVAVAYRYSHVSHPVLRDVQQKLGDVATVTEESIVGVHVVKSFAQEERRQALFERASGAVFDATVRAFRQRAIYVPLLSFLPLLAQAAVLLVAGRMVVSGSLSLSEFFVFNLLLAMLIVPLRSLGMWVGQAQRATASGERIFEVMDEPEGVDDRPGAVELPDGPGRDPLRAAELRLRRRPPRPARDRPRARAREDGRADRPHRLGQDDARRARAALLRRDRGARPRRRRRRPRRHAPLAPARDRRHLAGSVPLLRDRPREHRLRRPRRDATSGSSRRRAPRRRTSSSRSCRTATTP